MSHFCGRLLVGQGREACDPVCLLPPGHDDACSAKRFCANLDCRKPLAADRVVRHGATACDAKCRAAAWKARERYGRHPGPIPRTANGDAQEGRANGHRRKASGLQVSYRKALDNIAGSLAQAADHDGHRDPEAATAAIMGVVEHAMRESLSDKQRARLGERTQE